MRRFVLSLVVGCVGLLAPSFRPTEVAADEIAGTLAARAAAERAVGFDEVLQIWSQPAKFEAALQAWAKASRECRSYDATVTRWEYDPIFGDATKPKRINNGRYLFQRDGASRFVIDDDLDFVWRDSECLEIKRELRQYRVYSLKPAAADNQDAETPHDFGLLSRLLEKMMLQFLSDPKQSIPFLFLDDVEKFGADHDLTYELTPEEIRIVGEPKTAALSNKYRRFSVLIRTDESLPYAVKLELPSAGSATVFKLHEPKLDTLSPNADAFLNPDLRGLRRIDEETTHAMREKIMGKPKPAKKTR